MVTGLSAARIQISVVQGSILEVDAQVIINAANSGGVMGQDRGFVSQAVHGRLGLC